MSKRNIILITIVLVIIASVALGFMYFYKPVGQTGTGTTGTNFFSTFFPFGKSKTVNNATNNNPADISGYVAPTNSNNAKELLTEVSSMPVAGYTVFMKERFTNPSPALPKGEGGKCSFSGRQFK